MSETSDTTPSVHNLLHPAMKLTYYHNSFDQNLFIQEYNNGTLLHLAEN